MAMESVPVAARLIWRRIGILVLAEFPSSADWAIGLLVGIDLIFAGWTLTSVALLGKDLARS